MLSPDTAKIKNSTKTWFVLYTKPRHEKKLAQSLRSEGFKVYCPLKKTTKNWSDRKVVVEEALFPSFIFVQCEDKQRDKVFVHSSAVRYLFWLGKPAVIRDEEINTIRRWMVESNHESLEVEAIPIGSKVRLQSGPFMGQTAILEETRGAHATIRLEQLGIQVRFNAQQIPLDTI